jgi:unsaturated rhamnogalacturonyl hydrolase
MLMTYLDRYARGYSPYKDGAWCYEDGCVYRGLAALHDATGDPRWMGHLNRLADAQIAPDGALAGYRRGDYNIDNILSGRALIRLHATSGDPRYVRSAEALAAQLATHPRTRSGVYWHKLRYPWQVWLDGLYMGLPFQIEFGLLTGERPLVDDALAQLDTALALTLCPDTGLYAHGYDESRVQAWAHPETGRSSAHWGRALGWLAMALVDGVELVGPDHGVDVAASAVRLLRRLLDLRAPGGLWYQVVDRPDVAGNYVETSASAMFVYAMLKARRIGLFEPGTAVAADLAQSLERLAIGTDRAGNVRMVDICEVAGLGEFQGRYRDGSVSYYLSEARVADDPKGVGPLMMAVAEALSAGIALAGVAQEA